MKFPGKKIGRFASTSIVIVLLMLVISQKLRAQDLAIGDQELNLTTYKTDSWLSLSSPKGYLPSLFHNFREQATAPLRFSQNEWLMAYGALYFTTSFIYFDRDIDDLFKDQKQNNRFVNGFSPVITEFGGNPAIISVIGLGALSAVFHYEKGLETSLLATQAMITSGVWTRVIKILSGRERPDASYSHSKMPGGYWYGAFSQFTFDRRPAQYNSSFDSFISGHTAVAFSIATVFATQYKDVKWVPYLCYTTATLAGLSRLTEQKHWGSDVFAGALMGYLCGRQVVSYFNRIHHKTSGLPSSKPKRKAQLTLIPYGNQVGLCLTW